MPTDRRMRQKPPGPISRSAPSNPGCDGPSGSESRSISSRRARQTPRAQLSCTAPFVEAHDLPLMVDTEPLNRDRVIKTYARWAPIYDKVFGSVFEAARRAAVAACEEIGGRVLEVGVGTGISLSYYSPHCRVTGIDISEEMLEVARQRVAQERLGHPGRPGLTGPPHPSLS